MNPYRPLPSLTVSYRPVRSGVEESGFALITVLWLITALSAVVGLSMAATRLGNQTTLNRLALTRGRWAAEACGAIAQARWAQQRLADTATIDLGNGVRCRWAVDDPTAKINLNTVDREVLRGLGASEAFVHALVARRRQAALSAVGEAAELPGFDSLLIPLCTVIGPGVVNLSAATRRVLQALPGLTPEPVERILYRRAVRRPITSLDELAAQLSPPARGLLLARYADLARIAVFSPAHLVLTTEGWIESAAPRAEIELVVVPLADRLAVIGRRIW